MEQLIEGGAENMGLVFARVFDLAMQIERQRFLGAQHYERSPSRQGYANGYKRALSPASSPNLAPVLSAATTRLRKSPDIAASNRSISS